MAVKEGFKPEPVDLDNHLRKYKRLGMSFDDAISKVEADWQMNGRHFSQYLLSLFRRRWEQI